MCFPPRYVRKLGLGWDVLDIQALEYWGQVSYLKAGINFSERITTVSPTYAREILTPELGFGFDGDPAAPRGRICGILNGIDTERWNPADRPVCAGAVLRADDLIGQAGRQAGLLETAGLPADERALARPVIGVMSRLTHQKGFDLFAAAADELMALDASWVMLGSGDAGTRTCGGTLAARHPGRVSATIGFDERLAHLNRSRCRHVPDAVAVTSPAG